MIKRRRRFKHTTSLQERLGAFAEEARQKASHLPPGSERFSLLKKARQAETAARLDAWINPNDLQASTEAPGRIGPSMSPSSAQAQDGSHTT